MALLLAKVRVSTLIDGESKVHTSLDAIEMPILFQ